MPIPTASAPGVYDATSGTVICQYTVDLTGTNWKEEADGATNFLKCNDNNGAAVAEVLQGKGDMNFGLGPDKTISGARQGGLNAPGNTPAIKWLYNEIGQAFYKVIAVISDNLIQVEYIHGNSSGFYLIGCGTDGYFVKSLSLAVTPTDSITIWGYNISGANKTKYEYTDGGAIQVPLNVDVNGPVFVQGTTDTSYMVNVVPYTGGGNY